MQNLTSPLPNFAQKPNYFYSSRLSSHLKLFLSSSPFVSFCPCLFRLFFLSIEQAYMYIDKRSHDGKLLAKARSFSSSLRRTPLLEPNRIYENISLLATLDKNTLRHYCRAKREKGQENTSSNRKRIAAITSHNTRVVLHRRRDLYFIIKLSITFNANKLHRHD